LPLPLELRLVEVLLGERVLHLLEAVVVHARRIDVAAGQLGLERPAQLERRVDGAIGVVGVVDGDVNTLIHEAAPYGDFFRRTQRIPRISRPSTRSPVLIAGPFAETTTSGSM